MANVLGRKPGPSAAYVADLERDANGGEQWGQIVDAPGRAFWAIRAGANMQRSPSAAVQKATISVWDGGSGRPGSLLATTGYAPIPTVMTAIEADLGNVVMVQPGQRIVVGPVMELVTGGNSPANARLIQRDGGATGRAFLRRGRPAPANPFGAYSASSTDGNTEVSGHFATWVEGQYNSAPDAPIGMRLNGVLLDDDGDTPTVTTDITPTFRAVFRDDDEELRDGTRVLYSVGQADKLSKYQIRVTRGHETIWDSGIKTASTANQNAREFDEDAPALPTGLLRVRFRCADLFGAWSPESSALFEVATATTEASGGPAGKITTTQPATFGMTFVNTGSGSTNAVQVRLLRNGAIVKESPTTLKVIAPNASGSVTWSQSTFPTLVAGASYAYQARSRYTNANIWTNWSDATEFFVNAAPGRPAIIAPEDAGYAGHPTFQLDVGDPDDATDTLSVEIEVTRPDASVITLTDGYFTAGGRYVQGSDATVQTIIGSYTWRARATDPAGVAGPWSYSSRYSYGAFPNVAVTSVTPLVNGKVTSSRPTFSWTVDGTASPNNVQQRTRQVFFYDVNGDYFTRSGVVTTTDTTFHAPPSTLRQGDYEFEVHVWNSSQVEGVSPRFPFTIEYVPPPSLTGVQGQPASFPSDYADSPTGAVVTWDPTQVDPATFLRYEVWRAGLMLASIPNPAQVQFDDPQPPVNAPVTYEVSQVVLDTGEEVASTRVMTTTQVDLRDLVLTDAISGADDRVVIRFLDEIKETLLKDDAEVVTHEPAPTVIVGNAEYVRLPVSGRYIPADIPLAQRDRFRALIRKKLMPSGKKRPRVICLRDIEGRRVFGHIGGGAEIEPGQRLGYGELSFALTEVAFAEGVTPEGES